jgi:membrane protease YdiL (CAAX protease family)
VVWVTVGLRGKTMALKVRWLVFWYLVPTVAVSVWWAIAAQQVPGFTALLWVSSVGVWAYLAVVTRRRGWDWLGPLTWERWCRWFPLAAALAVGYWLLILGAEPTWARLWAPLWRAWGLLPGTSGLGSPSSLADGMLTAVGVAVLVPVVEEALFRGALLAVLSRWWGPLAGVLVSALAFGLVHDQAQVSKVALGLGLAGLALRSRTLVVPITVHALVNLLAVVALSLPTDRQNIEDIPGAVQVLLTLAGGGLLGWLGRKLVRGDHPEPRHRRLSTIRWRVSGPPVRIRPLARRVRFP